MRSGQTARPAPYAFDVIEWKAVPWPLWIYSAITVITTISLEFHGPVSVRVLFAIIMLVWLYLLLKGLRWVWILTVGVYVLGSIQLVWISFTWRGAAIGLVELLLLLLPETRRYFSSGTAAIGA
jgi:hypothetical protein